ncbi:MAG: metallophosphoesterase [Flavobacteriales bacterium]|nr:metallophosphoesterase [Flavobacteriales bacterium]
MSGSTKSRAQSRSQALSIVRILFFASSLYPSATLLAQRSPFNGLEVLPADSTGQYRILIGGHFHGESSNRSGYPASTLLANLDTINALGAQLFLSTGDLYMDARKDSARYARALFSKLKVPFFNAPGNHDRSGSTSEMADEASLDLAYHTIEPDSATGELLLINHVLARILVFDTELNDGSLSSYDLGRLSKLAMSESTLPVFIISHRPIWAEDDLQYSDLFKDNTRSLTGTNFRKEVFPILQRIAEHAQVYWISGSLGGQAPSSIFFQQHAPNITYIQCAIRDEPRDALLIADVHPDTVKWSAISLTGQELQAPGTYDAAWWRAQSGRGEGFNWRLLPYLIKRTLTRSEFWWGAAFAIVLVSLARRLYHRW